MSALEPEPVELFKGDTVMVVRWSAAEGIPVYDLGDMDEHAAVEIFRRVADRIESKLAWPREVGDDDDDPTEDPE